MLVASVAKQETEGDVGYLNGVASRSKVTDRAAYQLEARDGQEHDYRERA